MTLRDLDVKIDLIEIDACNDAQSAAEGATLSTYSFDEYKEKALKAKPVTVKLAQTDANLVEQYQRGQVIAEFQNKCRNLMEQPANLLTPTRFGEIAKGKIISILEIWYLTFILISISQIHRNR